MRTRRLRGMSLVMAALLVAVQPDLMAPGRAAGDDADPAPSDPVTALDDRLEATIPVAGSPDWPTAAFGSLWVLAPDLPTKEGRGTPNLIRIDPATDEVAATIELPDRLCQGLVASEDAIWVCAIDALLRIDPATETIVSTIPMKGAWKAYRPAEGGDRIWALGSERLTGDSIVSLDPATEATLSYPLGAAAGGLAYAYDAVWLTIPSTGSVLRLDPATGQTDELATGLPTPASVVAGSGDLWVSLYGGDDEQAMGGDAQLARIDPVSGETLALFHIGGSPRGGVDAWVDDGRVLVRSTMPWLTVIDAETNEVIETIAAEGAVSANHGPLTVAFDSIWTVNIEEDAVFRLSASP